MKLTDVMKNRVLLFDGAMGTMLGKYDHTLNHLPELLNVTNPALVESIHKRYIQAGSDVITTFTLGVNQKRLKDSAFTVQQIVRVACQNAKRAAEGAFVALCIGPSGYNLYAIQEDKAAISNGFAEILRVGIEEGVDAILFESFYDVQEARLAVLEAKTLTDLPLFLTFAFQKEGKTVTGDTIEQAIAAVEGLGLSAIGFNCSVSPSELTENLHLFKSLTGLPIMVQPNAGPSKIVNDKRVYVNNVEAFTGALKTCVQEGITIMGGCCGTTPHYIQSISKLKKHYSKANYKIKCPLISNALMTLKMDQPLLMGELESEFIINALKDQNEAIALKKILLQAKTISEKGIDLLAIHVHEAVDAQFISQLIGLLANTIPVPLILGSLKLENLKVMLQSYPGRCIVDATAYILNSELRTVFELAHFYGTLVICPLPIDKGMHNIQSYILQGVEDVLLLAMDVGLNWEHIIIDFKHAFNQCSIGDVTLILQGIEDVRIKKGILTHLDMKHVALGHKEQKGIRSIVGIIALTKGLDLLRVDAETESIRGQIRGLRALRG